MLSTLLLLAMVIMWAPHGVAAAEDVQTIWRVAWYILSQTDIHTAEDGRVTDSMTADEITFALQIVPYFESFIEQVTNGIVDVRVEVVVSTHPLSFLRRGGDNLWIDIEMFRDTSLDEYVFSDGYGADTYVIFGRLDEKYHRGYACHAQGVIAFHPTVAGDRPCSLPFETTEEMRWFLDRVGGAVHEQIHTMSSIFSKLGHDYVDLDGNFPDGSYPASKIMTDSTRTASDFRFFEGLPGYMEDIRVLLGTRQVESTLIYADILGDHVREAYFQDAPGTYQRGFQSDWWMRDVTARYTECNIALKFQFNGLYLTVNPNDNYESGYHYPLVASSEVSSQREIFVTYGSQGSIVLRSVETGKYVGKQDSSADALLIANCDRYGATRFRVMESGSALYLMAGDSFVNCSRQSNGNELLSLSAGHGHKLEIGWYSLDLPEWPD